MNFPIQAPPVERPFLYDPLELYSGIDINKLTDAQLIEMQVTLTLDANVNDPQWFMVPSTEVMKVSAWPGRR